MFREITTKQLCQLREDSEMNVWWGYCEVGLASEGRDSFNNATVIPSRVAMIYLSTPVTFSSASHFDVAGTAGIAGAF